MVKGFVKVDEGKVDQFVFSDVLLLQLANNKDGVSGTSNRHKTKLHLINVHHLVDVGVYSSSLMAWSMSLIDAKIVALIKGCTLAHIEVWNEALLPLDW